MFHHKIQLIRWCRSVFYLFEYICSSVELKKYTFKAFDAVEIKKDHLCNNLKLLQKIWCVETVKSLIKIALFVQKFETSEVHLSISLYSELLKKSTIIKIRN